MSLDNENICCEISEDKLADCGKTAGLRCGELFGFEFSVFESVSYRKNMSDLRHA